MDEDLEAPNNNVDKPLKTPPQIELPKPLNASLPDTDSELRKLDVRSTAVKATSKNKHLMNVIMEQDEPFWLGFEYGVSEWQTNKVKQTEYEHTSCDEENIMISSSDNDLGGARKKEL